MIYLSLQNNEAESVAKLLNAILASKQASDAVFVSGADRRSASRAARKIRLAMGGGFVAPVAGADLHDQR